MQNDTTVPLCALSMPSLSDEIQNLFEVFMVDSGDTPPARTVRERQNRADMRLRAAVRVCLTIASNGRPGLF
jgi:hypothetical protein